MKKGLLLFLALALNVAANAQVSNSNGIRKAPLSASFKNRSITVNRNSKAIDNQVPLQNSNSLPRVSAPDHAAGLPVGNEDNVGCTFYDLQTNNSISNRIVVDSTGVGAGEYTVHAAWTYSPDAIQTTNPPYPNRGTGYAFFDGNTNTWSTPACPPVTRTEASRTGFTNIVVTDGAEMTIAHAAVTGTGNFNRIALNWRSTKGSGPWKMSFPWGSQAHDTWPKAVGAGTNVYVIWQGSGAGATTTSSPPVVAGQNGPIYFSRNLNNGDTAGGAWEPKTVPVLIDSDYYVGFGGDSYSIDAKDNIVAISYGDTYTDIGLLKSLDNGQTWTKTIIQKHPIPFYTDNMLTDTNNDGIVDTLYTNGGDSKVLIDNNGMCHVWFSGLWYWNDSIGDGSYSLTWGTDSLEYWNENMATDAYVYCASSTDYSHNDSIDVPQDTFPASANCTNTLPWGNYGAGLTQMPSAGIDKDGMIIMAYASIVEAPNGDTTDYHMLHRHVFVKSLLPPYTPTDWSGEYDIVPNQFVGGYGEHQEGVFGCIARRVDETNAWVLYQRDDVPGHSLSTANSCQQTLNNGNASDMIVARVPKYFAGINSPTADNNIFVAQNYPNPVRGNTYINVSLKKSADIKLEVCDLVGKIVYSETVKHASNGQHKFTVNTTNYSSGIYTYSVTSEGQKSTRKMIVQ